MKNLFNSVSISKKNQKTYTKKLVFWVILNSELQVWASYLLAFLGHDQIAEVLSTQVIISIIGVAFVYMVKSLFENINKHKKDDDEVG